MKNALIDVTPLRVREFRRLWVGRTFSVFGSQMTLVAVLFQVWQSTSSTIWTGAVGLAQAVPLIACGLILGPVIDRTDRFRPDRTRPESYPQAGADLGRSRGIVRPRRYA
ncbi:hypothetical protein Lesp02_58680 [Lentzea sp. NBRC 105346]|uniref:hypothetical protein n=1 Tax=Lentzea sp. NBRC 105346 TaxID=3032205 RepID=UPI0024A1B776|nr:hypothetical protein [Lentzea sp. NBRC 105346]GLZ33680.1 hypothetical protein Lesp02_58680 [Lentzea sp. NBRC 105346]